MFGRTCGKCRMTYSAEWEGPCPFCEVERLRAIAEAAWNMRREARGYNPCPDLGLRITWRDRLYGLLDEWKAAEAAGGETC